jgi:hypothetical protein
MEYKVRIRQKNTYHYVVDCRVYNDTVSSNTTTMSVVSDSTDENEIYKLAYEQYATQNNFPETKLNNVHHELDKYDEMWICLPAGHWCTILYVKILNKNTSPN